MLTTKALAEADASSNPARVNRPNTPDACRLALVKDHLECVIISTILPLPILVRYAGNTGVARPTQTCLSQLTKAALRYR